MCYSGPQNRFVEGVTQMIIGCQLTYKEPVAVEVTLLIGIFWFGTRGEASLPGSSTNVKTPL